MAILSRLTLYDVIEQSVSKNGSGPALSFVGQPALSYAQLYNHVQSVREFLKKCGIRKGDKVGLLGENMPNWAVAYFAVTSMGAVIVPILPDFHTTEIEHILRHSSCRGIFVSARHQGVVDEGYFPALKIRIRLDDLQLISEPQQGDLIQDILAWGERELSRLRDSARQLLGRMDEEADIPPEEDELAAIIYTSGTTGHSKGVMLSHKNLLSDALACEAIIRLTPQDRLLSILPLAHTYECTIGLIIPIIYGSSIHYLDKMPTPRVLAEALEKVKPTIMLSVPLVIEKIFKTRILPQLQGNFLIRQAYRLPAVRRKMHRLAGKKMMAFFGNRLRFFGIGGAALSAETERFLYEAEFPYAIGYGLTETSPLIAAAAVENKRLRSTGPVLPGQEIRIEDADAETGSGEIWVKGPNVMIGYYNDPEQTAAVLDSEGWFRTGDLGRLDSDGFLFIMGRKKNVLVGPSGENIYPEQIENILNQFECINEALVYDDQGQVTARVHLNEEVLERKFQLSALDGAARRNKIKQILSELRQNTNQQVAGYARIKKIIEQVEPFQTTPTHKIKRYLYTK